MGFFEILVLPDPLRFLEFLTLYDSLGFMDYMNPLGFSRILEIPDLLGLPGPLPEDSLRFLDFLTLYGIRYLTLWDFLTLWNSLGFLDFLNLSGLSGILVLPEPTRILWYSWTS